MKIEVLKLHRELGLSYSQTAQGVGVTPKSTRDWCADKGLELSLSPPKIKFKKLPVAKSKRAAVVLELKSGAKVHGLSLNQLLQVIKDEAS